jgi:hypothetical protein
MKKNTIKLNETQLKKIVAESVRKVLKEGQFDGCFAECLKHLNAASRAILDVNYEDGYNADSQYTHNNIASVNKLNDLIQEAIILAKDLGANGRDGDFDASGYHSAAF